MDKEIQTALKNKEPIPKEIEIYIRKKGMITGSRVFGGFTSGESDIDVIVNMRTFPWCFDDLIPYGYYVTHDYRGDGYQSIYVNVRYSKHIHNLLLVFENYKAWCWATQQLKQVKKESPGMKELLKSKDLRVALFEVLKEECYEK